MTQTTKKSPTTTKTTSEDHVTKLTVGITTEDRCPGCDKPYIVNDRLGNFVCCPSHILARMYGAGIGWQQRSGDAPAPETTEASRKAEDQKALDSQSKPAPQAKAEDK